MELFSTFGRVLFKTIWNTRLASLCRNPKHGSAFGDAVGLLTKTGDNAAELGPFRERPGHRSSGRLQNRCPQLGKTNSATTRTFKTFQGDGVLTSCPSVKNPAGLTNPQTPVFLPTHRPLGQMGCRDSESKGAGDFCPILRKLESAGWPSKTPAPNAYCARLRTHRSSRRACAEPPVSRPVQRAS